MPPQELAFGAPRAEEMTAIAIEGAGAGMTGVVEGVIVQMAPQMGGGRTFVNLGHPIGCTAGRCRRCPLCQGYDW